MHEAAGQLAATVLSILAPYAARTGKEFVETVGEAAYQRAKGLMDTLKQRWMGRPENKEASDALENFEKKPERYAPVLKDVLEEKIAADPELAGELTRKTGEFGPLLEIIQRLDNAEGVTGLEAGQMASGKASITQEIKGGRNITGAKIDRLG
jgi:hypothetical protein